MAKKKRQKKIDKVVKSIKVEESIEIKKPVIEPKSIEIKSKDTTTEALNRHIAEIKKPQKQVKVKYPNGYICMMNIEIAKRLEKKDKFMVIV